MKSSHKNSLFFISKVMNKNDLFSPIEFAYAFSHSESKAVLYIEFDPRGEFTQIIIE